MYSSSLLGFSAQLEQSWKGYTKGGERGEESGGGGGRWREGKIEK